MIDGNAVYGSQKVTATPPANAPQGTVAGTFVAKNIKVDRYDADRGVSKDELGNEVDQWFMSKIPLGTMSLQFPSAATPAPLQYSTVAITAVGEATPLTFIIFKCGETYDAGGETMMDVSIALKKGQ